MTLAEFMKKPLAEAIEELELSDAKIHTDDSNNVQSVELKYKPKDTTAPAKKAWV